MRNGDGYRIAIGRGSVIVDAEIHAMKSAHDLCTCCLVYTYGLCKCSGATTHLHGNIGMKPDIRQWPIGLLPVTGPAQPYDMSRAFFSLGTLFSRACYAFH